MDRSQATRRILQERSTRDLQSKTHENQRKFVDYTFKTHYVPGKTHFIADVLSRAPVFDPEAEEFNIMDATAILVQEEPDVQDITDAIDAEYKALLDVVEERVKPENLPQAHPGRAYSNKIQDLSTKQINGKTLILMDGVRIVIPRPARKAIVN